jgi:hypothetical protein
VIVLHEPFIDPQFRINALAVGLSKEASMITEAIGLDH